jgi:hypothetical protein
MIEKKLNFARVILFSTIFLFSFNSQAQGTWTPIATDAPDHNGGGMLLLSDGSVLVKTFSGGSDGNGNIYDKLTPDIHGSYVNGTWSTIAPMINTRLYFSSQVLMDGRVYVAGGEYGTGYAAAEMYDPSTDTWTLIPTPGPGISDANSEILPDGKVLQAFVSGNLNSTSSYDPVTGIYTTLPDCIGVHDESAWVKLPDNSILFVDINSTNSERFIPSLNQWIVDATVPVQLYDAFGSETGGALLLPDGRAFFLGSTGTTAYYTPSGNNSPGTWAAGPVIPTGNGTPDAPAAMMVDGKILFTASPVPFSNNVFNSPTFFYEFDYVANTITPINGPNGVISINEPVYTTGMLDLPDGTVLFAQQDSSRYYVYTPAGPPLASGKPTISTVSTIDCDTFMLTGTLFNGISEGATYGDDWQMNTNYPLIRLSSGTNVYYARTFNWNSTGVMTGNMPDTTLFTLPIGLPVGMYALVVIANGIASDTITFIPCFTTAMQDAKNINTTDMFAYPNPATGHVNVLFNVKEGGDYKIKVMDISGKIILEETDKAIAGDNYHLLNIEGIAKGMYVIVLQKGEETFETKMVVK